MFSSKTSQTHAYSFKDSLLLYLVEPVVGGNSTAKGCRPDIIIAAFDSSVILGRMFGFL